MTGPEIGPTTDLSVAWDPEASRLARVLVSEGRLEIVLTHTDHEWVRRALETLDAAPPRVVVIACPT